MTHVTAAAGSGFITMTRELLEQGRSCMGGFSRPQFDLLGIETRRPEGCPINMNYLPKKWWLLVIGKEYTVEAYAEFLALKDKHLTPVKIAAQMRAKIRLQQRKDYLKATRGAETEYLKSHPLPDGMYDVERRGRREVWEFGKIIKWHLKFNVKNWGACPDAPIADDEPEWSGLTGIGT